MSTRTTLFEDRKQDEPTNKQTLNYVILSDLETNFLINKPTLWEELQWMLGMAYLGDGPQKVRQSTLQDSQNDEERPHCGWICLAVS
jgi:hypothetical protein